MWDFVKNAVVDSLDSVPEKYRGLYVEKDGKFTIADAAKSIVGEFTGLHATLADTKSKLTAANGEAASRRVSGQALTDFLKGQGVDNISADNPMETLEAHVTTLVEANKAGKQVKVDLDKIKKEAETRIANVATAAKAENDVMLGALKKHMVGEATARALADAKGNVEVLTPHITSAVRVIKEGEDYVVRVVDAQNTMRSNGAGQPMSINDLVAEMKGNKTFAANFESDTPTGNGLKPITNTRTGAAAAKTGEKSSTAKISDGLTKRMAGRA